MGEWASHSTGGGGSARAFARDESNAPIAANVYVGHYEARVSPIADTNPATGPADGSSAADASNLDNVATFTSRRYEFTANAPGYGFVRFRTSFRPGESRTIDLYFATNWASRHKGAVATGDGVRQLDLIDDTERTNWHAGGAPVQGRQVTVQLGGGAHKLDRAQVSAYLTLENEGNPEMPPDPHPRWPDALVSPLVERLHRNAQQHRDLFRPQEPPHRRFSRSGPRWPGPAWPG